MSEHSRPAVPSETPASRLGAAIRLSLAFREAGRHDVDAFLREHEHLRSLLGPMIGDGAESQAAEAAEPTVGHGEPFRIGATVAGYRLERRLGQGGMGTVFLATQQQLGRTVALKVLTPSLAMASERHQWRFRREARLLAELDHPGIVRVLEADEWCGVPFYAMEYVDGASLSAVLAAVRRAGLGGADGATVRAALAGALPAGAAPPPDVVGERSYTATMVELVAQVADAVAFAHAAGVIHRDVKPSNVLVRRDGKALLADFGIARHEDAAKLTLTGDLAGTPTYMAPEQARGEAVDHRADVFSLGVVLFEVLTLEVPFPGATPSQVLERLQHDDPVDPVRCNPALPGDLAAIVWKALQKEPNGRYQTAHEFAVDLRAFLAGGVVSARRPGYWQRLRCWARREPWRAAAVAIGTIGAIVLVGVTTSFTHRLVNESARAAKALAETSRLAINPRLDRAQRAAQAFQVAHHDAAPAMRQWIDEVALPLVRELPSLRDLLEDIRTRALPYDEAAAAEDRRTHPGAVQLSLVESELAQPIETSELSSRTMAETTAAERQVALRATMDALAAEVARRRTWQFESSETQFLHDQVEALVARLSAFAEAPTGALAFVRQQLAWVEHSNRRVRIDGAAAWREAIAAIASSPRYGGLRLSILDGFLPLGEDPQSGLWEFVHLRSGEQGHEVPPRSANGSVEPNEASGIVLVLLPGGTFHFGAQSTDPAAPDYDAEASPREIPVRPVTLAPFFIGKYEITQAQWRRASGGDEPSQNADRGSKIYKPDERRPVDSVTQARALEVLSRQDLTLPTEAQWEFAYRAGTSTPYYFGDRELVGQYGNFADATAAKLKATWPCEPVLTDGFFMPAPVGSFAPNAFGLHDMAGNLWEATLDRRGAPTRATRPGDGLRTAHFDDGEAVSYRGGAFTYLVAYMRASSRFGQLANAPNNANGVRAARAVVP